MLSEGSLSARLWDRLEGVSSSFFEHRVSGSAKLTVLSCGPSFSLLLYLHFLVEPVVGVLNGARLEARGWLCVRLHFLRMLGESNQRLREAIGLVSGARKEGFPGCSFLLM